MPVTLTDQEAGLLPLYVKLNEAIAKKASAMQKSAAADVEQIKKASDDLVDVLISRGLLDRTLTKQANDMLHTHLGALSVLRNTVDQLSLAQQKIAKQAEAGVSAGEAVPPSSINGASAASGYEISGVPQNGKRASDRRMFERLGLNFSS